MKVMSKLQTADVNKVNKWKLMGKKAQTEGTLGKKIFVEILQRNKKFTSNILCKQM